MNRLAWLLTPFPCAAILCLANAFKPAVIDDLAYLWYARQIVETPSQPFGPPPDGFTLIWYDRAQGAFTLLTPMVVPYWLAAGLAIFGENLVLLKLWLFPFCLALTASGYSLLRRFAPGYERPLLAAVVLSPAFMPSLNLMVDVPAAALGLAAVALFATALDAPGRWRSVIGSGILAGLAAQTKYTGLTATATILLYALLYARFRAGLVAAAVSAAIFIGWESYLTQVYGRSHFLLQVEQRRVKPAGDELPVLAELVASLSRKASLVVPLGGVLGGVGAALIPLAAVALRARPRLVRAALALPVLGFALMAAVPEPTAILHRNPQRWREEVSVSTIVVGLNGVLVCGLLMAVVARLGFRGRGRRGRPLVRREQRSWFLIGWLGIELAGYFALSPFAAARRVLGVYVAAAMLVGRLLTLTARSPERRRLGVRACVLSVALGVLFAATDFWDAVAEKETLATCVDWISPPPAGPAAIWFCGHWGLQYYAERAGLKAVHPGESVLNEGDWLIYPESLVRPYSQLIVLECEWAEKVATVEWRDDWPLRTNPEFYDSYQPIRRHEGHRLRVHIFRVKKKFRAQPV